MVSQFAARPAHPRSRGENLASPMIAMCAVGSSPLTRGKQRGDSSLTDWRGLIPAHAGKTRPPRHGHRRAAAHPRSRGENDGGFAWLANFPGSSPLTRGKLIVSVRITTWSGLIPAHAGKTDVVAQMASTMRAHPRSRGENVECTTDSTPRHGSSPLTRGKPLSPRADPPHRGLIPAHAGKTHC